MWIKLDGETLMGHQYFEDAQHTIKVSVKKLVNKDGDYKYKYVAGKLVELTQNEIDNHPLVKEKKLWNKFNDRLHKKARKLALKELKTDSDLTQDEKDWVQARIDEL